jgi:carbon-monoxide dehydrogenase medium subunit
LSEYAPTSGSLILEVILPRRGLLSRSAFVKLGSRRDMTISRLNLAMLAEFQNDRFGLVRIVAGALGPAARRLHLGEMALVGRKLEPTALRGFISTLVGEVDTAIPGRNSQPYKRRAVAGLGLDLIAQAMGLSPRDRLFEEAAE